MTSVLRRMQIRLPDSDFVDSRPATRSDILAKKVAGIFPKRSIWRSLGLDYSNNPSENGGSLACLARAARELPQLVKRACSPSNYLTSSSPLSSSPPEPLKRPVSGNNRIRPSSPGRLSPPPSTDVSTGPPADRSTIRNVATRLSDITPVLERYGQLSNTASSSKVTFLSQPPSARQPPSLQPTQPLASATEKRSSSPLFRRSLSPNSRLHGQSTETAPVKRLRCDSLSSTCQRDASTSPLPSSEPQLVRPFLTTSSCYYQPDFDCPGWNTSGGQPHPSAGTPSSPSIEIPSWHVNDLLANYATELGPSKFLRPRPSFNPPTTLIKRKKSSPSSRPSSMAQRSTTLPSRHLRRNITTKAASHPHDRSRATHSHADVGDSIAFENAGSDIEDTDDAVYQLRHSKFEVEEIKRERVSHQRMVEEELRSRLEQRDLESWGRRQVTRTDPLADLNPEKHMPTQLDYPLSRSHVIHVVDSIPVVAFGCYVPKPTFTRFSLT